MPIELPNFDEYDLLQLGVCAYPRSNDPAVSEWLKGLGSTVVRQPGGGDVLYLRRFGDTSGEDHGHYHLEAARQSIFGIPPHAEEGVQAVLDTLGPLEGLTIGASLFAKFVVHRHELPERGMIVTLLGASQPVEIAELVLTGCEMAVRGDVPYSSVRWRAAEEGEGITVDIQAYSEILMDDGVLLCAAEIMREGLRALVLEQHREEDHAKDNA